MKDDQNCIPKLLWLASQDADVFQRLLKFAQSEVELMRAHDVVVGTARVEWADSPNKSDLENVGEQAAYCYSCPSGKCQGTLCID